MLEIDGLSVDYGPIRALQDVSLRVERGQLVGILGANGAGKTTLLRTISGLMRARNGSIRLDGQEIRAVEPEAIVRLGIAQVPEGRGIFPDLTVRENLEIAIKPGAASAPAPWTVDRIYEMFPVLAPLDARLGGYLSGGEQQMLTIGRTLMGNPSLLLLDEPVAPGWRPCRSGRAGSFRSCW